MDWLTAIVYALSRGFWSAYLDCLKERESAREETVTDEDRARAARFRAAAAGVPIPAAAKDAPKSGDTPPDRRVGNADDMGTPPGR